MDFISRSKGDLSEQGRIRIKVFTLNDNADRLEYEHLLNDSEITILEEHSPTIDKSGKVLLIVKWLEP